MPPFFVFEDNANFHAVLTELQALAFSINIDTLVQNKSFLFVDHQTHLSAIVSYISATLSGRDDKRFANI